MDIPVIPGYDILAPLPHGGMSAVFKARQVLLDRVVVLKILPPSMAADGVDVDKLLAEAKITAQLKHTNIVQVYDFGKSPDGIYYFVMEFVSGYSVADWIRRKKSLSAKDALLCACCVAEALSYAWETFGVVHCDIKPDNVIIDGDGTVKVADLGLARSVRSVMDKAKLMSGVVVGTPYYISPEQSQGRLELDCRADIYSLGAMLYHCLSGKMPFEGLPLQEVMDCQITDQIPDLIELQPHASMAVACLIEKMMAKNPAHRQKDWRAVMHDMIRARSEIIPEGPLPPAGASTMKRCVARAQYLKTLDASAHAWPGPKPSAPHGVARPRQWIKPELLAAVIMILSLAVPGVLVLNMLSKPRPGASPQDGGRPVALHAVSSNVPGDFADKNTAKTEAVVAVKSLAEPGLFNAHNLDQQRFEEALHWYQANTGQYNEAIQQFSKIAGQWQGTRYAKLAEDEIARIRQQKRAAVAANMKVLRDQVRPLLDQQKWQAAAKLFEQYDGPFKTETEAERMAQVREWIGRDRDQQTTARQAAATQIREQQRQWNGVLDEIATRLVEGSSDAALAVVRQATNNPVLYANRNDLLGLASMLAKAGRADQCILDSFRLQKDLDVIVALTNGPKRLIVRDVQADTILAEKIIVVSAGQIAQPKVFRVQDLSLEEKLSRLGTNATPDTVLMRGLVAIREGNWDVAEACWNQTGPLLAAPLMSKLQARKKHQLENQARGDFILLLRAAQVEPIGLSGEIFATITPKATNALANTAAPVKTLASPGLAKGGHLSGCEVYAAAIAQKKYALPTARILARSVADYQEQYGQTVFAQAYAPALAALKQVLAAVPDSNKTVNAENVPGMAKSTHPYGAAVCQELLEKNPGMTELNITFVTNETGKIVRAELIALDLKDVAPLAGLPDLRAVVCAVMQPGEWRESSVKAPLSDLSPLKELPLQEVCVSYTRVKDLAPLAGMALTKLNIAGTRVTDLSALKGMPLRELSLSHLLIKDLKLLVGLPLESLNISHTEVSDLAPLTGMKLKRLIANDSRIRDIKVLAGMPLTELNLSRTEVADLSPLMGMKIENLNLNQTRVRDLAVLADMPLRWLDLGKTKVKDLAPLQGLALEMLNVSATRVKDLDPLRNMPLKWLGINESLVRDLEPIQNLPIEEIWLDYNPDQQTSAETYRAFAAVLLRMPQLQKVNGNVNFRERRGRE